MNQYGWFDCPMPVRSQIETFVQSTTDVLGSNLRGVYLHGSLAMGCFNPARSDIDLLVVTHAGMDRATTRHIAALVLTSSNAPHSIEISFVCSAHIAPWQYPTPFDFHYSEGWRDRVTNDLATDRWHDRNDTERCDPDLAAHITVTLERGIALLGPPPDTVFPAVPANDYVDSIWRDVKDLQTSIDRETVYGTLNLCRVYAFVRDGLVCSKDEGGRWALGVVAPQFRPLVREALDAYRGERADDTIDHYNTVAFVRYMLDQIALSGNIT